MSVYQRAETFIHQRKFREGGSTIEVDEAVMHIDHPCNVSQATIDMIQLEDNTYQGQWVIPDDALYGEYTVTVTTTLDGCVSKFVDSFIVLPWNITQHIRQISGAKESKDIDNDDLSLIAWNAYLEARLDVFSKHHDERVRSTAFHCFNGNNTTFYVRRNIVTDHLTCHEVPVSGYMVTCCGVREEVLIEVLNAKTGKVRITCLDGSPITSYVKAVYVTYFTYSDSFEEGMFKKAVVYLAAHELILRFHELDKATLADLQSNAPVVIANPDRMLKHYKRIVSKIGVCKYGGIK